MDKHTESVNVASANKLDYQVVFEKIEIANYGIERLKNAVFKQYAILVDAAVSNHLTDQSKIEKIMDGLLDYGDEERFCDLYGKLCRHVYYTYPQMVGRYAALFRAQFAEGDGAWEDGGAGRCT